jgi:4-hydroxy-tetrahydrodipicolinate synthase
MLAESMTKRFIPKGVMPALVTPFTKDGDLLEEGLKQVIDYTIEKGATGLVPAGTTGEFVYMRTEERKKLLKLAVEFADGRVPVVAGTGQNSTRATVALTKYAADIGCDAALVISPFYLRPADKGYYEHYETVARKADLPIIVYNIPQVTLGWVNTNVIEDLAELDNIVGVKDSSGHIGHVVETIQKLKDLIPVLIGHDECFLSAVAAGASAAIMASGNIMPHLWLKIMEHVKKGDMKKATELQHSLQTLARIVTRNGGSPPVKAALRKMGMKAGYPRMPLDSGGTLTRELKEEIRLELEKLKLIEPLTHPSVASEIDVVKILKSDYDIEPADSAFKQGRGHNETVSASVIVGSKRSVLGSALVRLLTTPKIGHEALTVILEPNLTVRPTSIMLPVKKIMSMRQASLFYGPVQSGAAQAVARYLESGAIPDDAINEDVILMALDIDLNERDRRSVVKATEAAVTSALAGVWG